MKAFLAGALVFAFSCAAMAQIAVLQIKVLEGEGAVHPAGAHVAHPITVEVTDDTGQPVRNAAVTFQLPPDGPSGLFSNGLRTDLAMTDGNGRAAIHAVQWNRTGGQVRIRVTAVKEQARAGIVVFQIINGPSGAVTKNAGAEAAKSNAPAAARTSAEITPTSAKMAPKSHKKWVVLAILAAGGGVAVAGVSHASSHNSTGSGGAVTIGTPSITIGHP